MKASLDTNVIIHLYKANQQHILFSLFGKNIFVYEFLVNQELKTHGQDIMQKFMDDVADGKITIITDDYLKECGIYSLFKSYYQEDRPLYNPGDTGEVYAIALARTLGAMSIVTDDTKIGGPHATLMRLPSSDVIPFSFCEVLFLLFLENKVTINEILSTYNAVIEKSNDFFISLKSEFEKFVKRFSLSPYSEREKQWMSDYCKSISVDFTKEIKTLKKELKKIL